MSFIGVDSFLVKILIKPLFLFYLRTSLRQQANPAFARRSFYKLQKVMKNQRDFKGILKWKLLVPFLFIASWICMILGPLFFSYGYQIFCLAVIGYSLIKTLGLGVSSAYALYRLKKTLNKFQKVGDKKNASNSSDSQNQMRSFYHAVVIPSYKEDQQLLKETLLKISMHPQSTHRFLIILGMEAHEQRCEEKAQSLITSTKHLFRYIGFTKHQIRQGEAKGKASNVSWAVEHMLDNFQGLMINKQDIMITVIDADSWAPKQYFMEMEDYLRKKPHHFSNTMFCVPQIYTRNHLEVPVFNRIYDTMHSLVHISTMVAFYFSFPLSNYSLSYTLIQSVGFWDTNADAIGEDFHTCQKLFWKTLGPVHTVSIYTPFNQLSLSTGKGYCSDIKARFWQLERHTRGVSDAAYSCNMLTKAKFQCRNIILTFLVLEVFFIAAIVPWAILAIGIQYKVNPDESIWHFPQWIIDLVLNLTPALTLLSYIFYQIFRRIANKHLYNQENDPIWRSIEYPILFVIALFGYSIPAFILSSFGVICTQTEYRVAEKKVADKAPLESEKPIVIQSLDKEDSQPSNKKSKKSDDPPKEINGQKKSSTDNVETSDNLRSNTELKQVKQI